MSTASVDLLDLQEGAEGGGRVSDHATDRAVASDRKQPDMGSISSAGSADDEGDLLGLIPEKSAACDHHADGMKSSALVFERISEEERGSSDSSEKAEKGSPDRDKGSTGSRDQESDEESSKSSKRSCPESEKGNSPATQPHAALPAEGLASGRPSLTRMTAITSSTITKDTDHLRDVPIVEEARVREGMHTILHSFSTSEDPFKSSNSRPNLVTQSSLPVAPPTTASSSTSATNTYSLAQLSPSKVKLLLPVKPAPERLLPIGPRREPSPKPVLLRSLSGHESKSNDARYSPVERLLPIGPPRDRSKSPGGHYKKVMSPTSEGADMGLFFDPLPTCKPPPKPPRLHQLQETEAIAPLEADVVVKQVTTSTPVAAKTTGKDPIDPPNDGKSKGQDERQEKQEKGKVSEAPSGKASHKPHETIADGKEDGQPLSSEKTVRQQMPEPKKKEKKTKRKKEGRDSADGNKSQSVKETKKKSLKQESEKTRQATLESLGHSISLDMDNLSEAGQKPGVGRAGDESRPRQYKQRRQQRRAESQQRSLDNKSVTGSCGGVAAGVQRRARKSETTTTAAATTATTPGKRASVSQASMIGDRSGTSVVGEEGGMRCGKCSNVIEEFSEEEMGMCMVILRTYVHREPGMAAPMLPEMLKLVARFTSYFPNAWQYERFVRRCSHFP